LNTFSICIYSCDAMMNF